MVTCTYNVLCVTRITRQGLGMNGPHIGRSSHRSGPVGGTDIALSFYWIIIYIYACIIYSYMCIYTYNKIATTGTSTTTER